MEKKIDIIYFGDLLDVNGVNFVTNSFLVGNKYFLEQGFSLNKIYGHDIQVDCKNQDNIPITHTKGKKWDIKTKLKLSIKKMLFNSFSVGIWIIFKKNFLNKARLVIEHYQQNEEVEYIIFQDLYTAFFYYKRTDIIHKKSILILHCGVHAYDQLFMSYPTLSVGKYKQKLEDIRDFAFKNVDKIVYLSQRVTKLNDKFSSKTSYIYNGLEDIDNLKFKLKDNIINIISVASMNYRKGHELIIEGFNRLDENYKEKFKIYFAGSGAQEPELRELVQNYKLTDRIEFLGVRNDVPKLLEQMDVLVLLSKSEGLPLCIIEGLRQGLYIIGTDVGGISEMIESGFGKVVDSNSENVADTFREIIIEDKIKNANKVLARAKYEQNFTLQKMVNSYCKLLTSIE